MISLLYGADSYRRNKRVQELIREYRGKYKNIDLFAVDLEEKEEDWVRIKEFLLQPSMFGSFKVVVIKESGVIEEKEWIKFLKTQLTSPQNFILISDANKPKKSFLFLLKSPVRIEFYEMLVGNTLSQFLKEEILSRGLFFAYDAWQFFHGYINAQVEKSWLAVNTLDKIKLAKFSSPISLVDLRLMIHWREKENIFFLTKQLLGNRNFSGKLIILEELFLQKEPPAYLFNLLSYQVNSREAVLLADYDVSIKSGGLDYEEALTDFALT